MDIEELTKSQIMLLTLLVSFVTSIATGIVTVSLMDQAPPVIAQTVNRVVERTVERVVPSETQLATVVTKEKTVVVKESELIPAAVARVQPSLVRILKQKGAEYVFAGFGIALTPTVVVTEAGILTTKDVAVAEAIGGGRAPIALSAATVDSPLALVSIVPSDVDPEETPVKFSGAALSTDTLKLGQTMVALFGTKGIQVKSGIVTNLTTEDEMPGAFSTDITASVLVPGAVLVNTDGAVVGMYTKANNAFVDASVMTKLLADATAPVASATTTPTQ